MKVKIDIEYDDYGLNNEALMEFHGVSDIDEALKKEIIGYTSDLEDFFAGAREIDPNFSLKVDIS